MEKFSEEDKAVGGSRERKPVQRIDETAPALRRGSLSPRIGATVVRSAPEKCKVSPPEPSQIVVIFASWL